MKIRADLNVLFAWLKRRQRPPAQQEKIECICGFWANQHWCGCPLGWR